MTTLKYVCLSDLHLGDRDSILTHIDSDGNPRPQTQSPTLQAFGTALRKLVGDLCDRHAPPTLVLLGDILDLGQAPVSQAAMGFQRLVEALFPASAPSTPPPPFASTVYYVPGNHDHHLWQSAKAQQYLDQVETDPSIEPAPVTRLFEPPSLKSELLTKLLRNTSQRPEATVKLAYPNLGEIARDGKRSVVFHHGHFIESLYRLMSNLPRLLGEEDHAAQTVAELEQQNATWIDFVWSMFGSTGPVGQSVEELYSILLDNAATNNMISQLANRIVQHLQTFFPMAEGTARQHYSQLVVKVLLDIVVGQVAQRERNAHRSVLTNASLEGLRWYLEEPLYRQLCSERPPAPNGEKPTVTYDMSFRDRLKVAI